jgi:hypothetical protein
MDHHFYLSVKIVVCASTDRGFRLNEHKNLIFSRRPGPRDVRVQLIELPYKAILSVVLLCLLFAAVPSGG